MQCRSGVCDAAGGGGCMGPRRHPRILASDLSAGSRPISFPAPSANCLTVNVHVMSNREFKRNNNENNNIDDHNHNDDYYDSNASGIRITIVLGNEHHATGAGFRHRCGAHQQCRLDWGHGGAAAHRSLTSSSPGALERVLNFGLGLRLATAGKFCQSPSACMTKQ